MTRLDAMLDWFLRPRVRRVTRWSFVVTLPLCALLISLRGLDTVLVIFAIEFAAFMLVLVVAARLGGERGEVILDFVMHPTVRRFVRSEALIVLTLPRALLRVAGVGRRSDGEYPYREGNVMDVPLRDRDDPAFAAKLVMVHLLLPDSLGWLRLAVVVLSLYGVICGSSAGRSACTSARIASATTCSSCGSGRCIGLQSARGDRRRATRALQGRQPHAARSGRRRGGAVGRRARRPACDARSARARRAPLRRAAGGDVDLVRRR